MGSYLDAGDTFDSNWAALNYADANGLDLVWEGTAAFAKRRATLPAGAFDVRPVRTRKGITNCGLFSKRFAQVEFLVKQGIVEVDYSSPEHPIVKVLNKMLFEMCGGLKGNR
jgi:hypothetical protein